MAGAHAVAVHPVGRDRLSLPEQAAQALAAGGPLSRAVPGWEPRSSQVRMAQAIARALERGRTILIEAPTGSGKSLAALVPLALHLAEGRGRASYSTATITLQEQLLRKDLPAVQRALGGPQAALLKGMGRYLCLLRWGMFGERHHATSPPDDLPAVAAWVRQTTTGDQNELATIPSWWEEVAADPSDCLGPACGHALACFALRARDQARRAPLLVCNHHLLLLQRRFGRTAPDDLIVFDEAHHLPEVAGEVFGASFTDETFRTLARRFHGLVPEGRDPLHGEITRAVSVHDAFMARAGRAEADAAPIPPLGRAAVEAYLAALDRLARAVEGRRWDIFRDRSGTSANDRAAILLRSLASYRQSAAAAFLPQDGVARWVEAAGGRVTFHVAPVEVGQALGPLFAPGAARVLMSATLAAGGQFTHIRRRCGITDADELLLPPVFDYASQMRYYLPREPLLPTDPGFTRRAADELARLLRATRGRALVLFTSYAQLREVAEALRGRVPYRLLVQDTSSTTAVVQAFREEVSSVLLGAGRLWEGLDIPGPTLSALVVVRLPFEVPTHPLARARYEAARARGEDPFLSVVVPDAILRLRQGVGRLIRSSTDRGVVAILDGRVVTRAYGRRFLAALPPAPHLRTLEEVAAFLP